MSRNGDHTILMDEPARQHIEDLAERTSYFTTNLVIMDIKVGSCLEVQISNLVNQLSYRNNRLQSYSPQDPYRSRVVEQLLSRVMPELKTSPDVVEIISLRTGRDRLVVNDEELLVDNSFAKVKGGFGEVMLVRDPAENEKWILKKHNSRFPLEFYFLREARKRLIKAANVHAQVRS